MFILQLAGQMLDRYICSELNYLSALLLNIGHTLLFT